MARYAVADLAAWTAAVLRTAGVPAQDAGTTARLLVRSDARGYGTHGLARLPSYLQRLREGDFNAAAEIGFHRRGAAWLVEADGALGQVIGPKVIAEARAFLHDQPILWVSVKHTGHLGALGVIALEAAEAGLVCFMGQRTPPLLGLPGFSRAALGHNPFAFASPAGERPPLVFDMACSVAARGHILLAAREGRPIPDTWALDPSGRPTTDAQEAAAGSLQPAGGYKGMGLAMMIECMAAALAATAESASQAAMKLPAAGAVGRESAFFLFINPSVLGDPSAFDDYMAHWIRHYAESSEPAARLPGERGHREELRALESGLGYSTAIETDLKTLAGKLDIPFPTPCSA